MGLKTLCSARTCLVNLCDTPHLTGSLIRAPACCGLRRTAPSESGTLHDYLVVRIKVVNSVQTRYDFYPYEGPLTWGSCFGWDLQKPRMYEAAKP